VARCGKGRGSPEKRKCPSKLILVGFSVGAMAAATAMAQSVGRRAGCPGGCHADAEPSVRTCSLHDTSGRAGDAQPGNAAPALTGAKPS